MMAGHPVKWIRLGDCNIPIDAKIADLVILLNLAGFATSESCQNADVGEALSGHAPWVRIGLLELTQLPPLVKFGRVAGINTDLWEFEVWSDGGELACYVLFPFSDVPRLEGRLRRFLA